MVPISGPVRFKLDTSFYLFILLKLSIHKSESQKNNSKMKIPSGSRGFFDLFAQRLVAVYRYRIVRFLIGPALLAVPPTLLMALYSNPAAKIWLASNAPQISSWLMKFWWIFIALSAIYPTIILTIAKAVARRAESNGLSVDGLLALLASLDAIVGCKVARFAKQAASGDTISKEDAFCTITQPEIQIAEIVREVCNLFNATRTGRKKPLIRVTLAVMKDGKITNLPIYYPADEPVRASIKKLNNPDSAIICAAKLKKIVVIEDIQKELR